MAKEKVIISVEIDKEQAQKGAAKLTAEITKQAESVKILQKTLKGLIADQKNLDAQRGESYQALLKLEAAGRGNTDEARLLRIEIKKLNDDYNTNQLAIQRTSNELVTSKTEITANKRELRVLNRELEVNEGNLNAQRALLSKATRKFDEFRVGIDGTADELAQLGAEIDQLNTKIKEQEYSTGRFQRNVGNYADGIRGAFESAIPSAGNLSAALTTPAGAVAGLAAAIGTGVVELGKFQQKLEAQRKEIELLTGATGANLDNINASISATAKTTGTDFNENLIASNAVAKTFGDEVFGVTQDIQKGFAAGGNVTGEYLDTLKEYAPIFQELNLKSSEFIAITTQQLKAGVFSDSGIATIEEGLLRIREMPDATAAALDAIGLSSSEISQQIASGETGVFEVIQRVSSRLGELPPQSQQVGQAIADIFGGAGEKAGLEYIKTLKDVDTNLDRVLEKSGEFADRQFRLTQANQELNLVFNQLLGSADGFFEEAKIGATELLAQGLRGLINGVIDLSNWFIKLYNSVLPLRIAVQGLFAGIRTAIDTVQFALTTVYDAFKNLGSIIMAVLSGDLSQIKEAISNAFSDSVDNIKNYGSDVAENYVDGYNNVMREVELISPLGEGENGIQAAKEIGGKIGKALGVGISEGAASFDFDSAINDAIGEINLDGIEADNELLRLDTESRISDLERMLKQEDLLFAQNKAKGIADEEAHNLKLLELQREKLGLEAALLEEGSQAKIDKLIEVANIEAQIYEDKEQRKKDFDDELRAAREAEEAAAAEAKAARLAQERAQEDAQLAAASEAVNTLAQLARTRTDDEKAQAEERKQAFKEQNAIYKAAVIAQKAIAAIEIGINLQREIQSYWASSATAGPAAPAIAIPLTIAAVARGAAALANIARFEDGGRLSNGTNGLAIGASHADGGIFATVGNNRLINFEGGEYIIKASAVRNNPEAVHALNTYGDRVKMNVSTFALGGALTGAINSAKINNTTSAVSELNKRFDQLENAILNQPAPVVTVEDINAGIEGVRQVRTRANQ